MSGNLAYHWQEGTVGTRAAIEHCGDEGRGRWRIQKKMGRQPVSGLDDGDFGCELEYLTSALDSDK